MCCRNSTAPLLSIYLAHRVVVRLLFLVPLVRLDGIMPLAGDLAGARLGGRDA